MAQCQQLSGAAGPPKVDGERKKTSSHSGLLVMVVTFKVKRGCSGQNCHNCESKFDMKAKVDLN